MARGGYKFFDTDAHVGPYVDVLDPYLTVDDKQRLEAWSQYKASSKNAIITIEHGIPPDLSARIGVGQYRTLRQVLARSLRYDIS